MTFKFFTAKRILSYAQCGVGLGGAVSIRVLSYHTYTANDTTTSETAQYPHGCKHKFDAAPYVRASPRPPNQPLTRLATPGSASRAATVRPSNSAPPPCMHPCLYEHSPRDAVAPCISPVGARYVQAFRCGRTLSRCSGRSPRT